MPSALDDLEEGAVEGALGIVTDEPERAPGVLGGALDEPTLSARLGARAVGDDHQVVRAELEPARSDHDAATRSPAQLLHGLAAPERDPRLPGHGVEEHVEEHAAMQAEPVGAGVLVAVAEVDDVAPLAGHAVESVHSSSPREHGLEEPEALEDAHPRRLQHDPRADGGRLGHRLVDGDAMTRPGQEEGGRGARGATADDAHVESLHGPSVHRLPSSGPSISTTRGAPRPSVGAYADLRGIALPPAPALSVVWICLPVRLCGCWAV